MIKKDYKKERLVLILLISRSCVVVICNGINANRLKMHKFREASLNSFQCKLMHSIDDSISEKNTLRLDLYIAQDCYGGEMLANSDYRTEHFQKFRNCIIYVLD